MPPINLSYEVLKHNNMEINGTLISSISGPVSFYYLRPTFELSKLPLIILFGDYHRSRDQMCVDCTCSKGKKSCCYKISDPALLQLFDTLGSSEYPVDFYTETSFLGTGKGFENGEMEILTTGDMTSCYHHGLRDTKYDKCPTRNIRWHAGDIRQATMAFYDYFTIKINSNNTVSKYKETSKYYKNNVYFESELSFIFSAIEILAKITEENFALSQFGTFDNFKKFILLLFENNKKILSSYSSSSLHKFATSLFSMKNSAINKQVEKQFLDKFKNKKVWVDLYAKSVYNYIQNSVPKRIDMSVIKTEIELTTLENIHEDIKKEAWNVIQSIIIYPLLDMYVLSRMFKQPTGGKISSLSFGYFGDYHVKNMVDLLISLDTEGESNYELVERIDFDKSKLSRCLKMPPIDITYELLKHNEGI
jgi:hypothetical protein